MHVEHRVVIKAPPEVIFRIYQDVAHWPAWDPDTKRALLDGPFQVGSRGSLTPTEGNTVSMVLTEVEPDRCVTVESRIPLFRMVFEHVLTPVPGCTEVLHRATFSGALSWLLGPMLVRQLRAGLPVTLGKLQALAEARAHGGAA